MFDLISRRDMDSWLRDPVGRDCAVLILVASGLAVLLEPTFNPLVGAILATAYLLNAWLLRRRQIQPRRPARRYRRSLGSLISGALGGLLLGGLLALAIATFTGALFDSSGLTWNVFVGGMVLGGILIGIKYIWQNSSAGAA